MITARLSRAAAAACTVALLGLLAAGCGSKTTATSSGATSRTTTSIAAAPAVKSTSATAPATTSTANYHAGEFCSASKQTLYGKLGFTCVKGRLKKT